jgi:hypothetical protein
MEAGSHKISRLRAALYSRNKRLRAELPGAGRHYGHLDGDRNPIVVHLEALFRGNNRYASQGFLEKVIVNY